MNHRTFWEAGHRVFGLHTVSSGNLCGCGDPHCKAVLKHPLVSNWQHTPVWSEEQLEVMEEMGQFATGYAILLRDLLVVDVDARNGGLASYARLCEDVPSVSSAGLIVETGSGGGSKHLYFRAPSGVALVTKHPDYPGIDFKSGAAYVVGPGSLHASGRRYAAVLGTPDDIEDMPDDLLSLIIKPERHRADMGGKMVDVSHQDLADMLRHINNNDVDYEMWVRVGMALHHASGGTAYDLWEAWSSTSSKHDPSKMPQKWHSFGKSANPVTLGTLVHYAEQGGWKQPVTFTPTEEFDFPEPQEDTNVEIDTRGVDLLRPPGLTGLVAEWIFNRGRRPREKLAAMAALFVMGNIAGLRYIDDRDRATTNLFVFNVSGSGTGKEAIGQAIAEIMQACGLSAASHGTIKSEQEITRNLTRHQAAFYLIDEVGFLLQKIKSAQKRGGAMYMEGVTGLLMSAYSKGDGVLTISGDVKEEIRADLLREMSRIQKSIDENGENTFLLERQRAVEHQLTTLDMGLVRPFLSLSGFTTPRNFDELVDFESTANGFIGRCIIAVEPDTTPPTRLNWKKEPLPENLKMALQQIAMGGTFDLMKPANARVEHYGERIVIPTERAASTLLDNIIQYFDRKAEEHKTKTGLEAILLRGYELVTKVSLILAVPEGVRTVEHVRWAFELVKKDLQSKMRMVTANDRVLDAPALALKAKIAQLISGVQGETLGVIENRLRQHKKEDIKTILEKMVELGEVVVEETIHKYRKIPVKRYKLVD